MGHRNLLGNATAEYWEILSSHFGIRRPEGEISDCIPVSLFGDEVEVFDSLQYMCINWSSEVALHHTNAKLTKFLCVMIPTTAYCFEGKVNITLQHCLQILVASLNRMYTDGAHGLKMAVASVKGDWKFMCQAINSKHGPSSNHICFRCMATKDLTTPMTDLSAGAAWRQMHIEEEDMWHRSPALKELSCFSTKLMCPDLLHTYHLGCGRDIVASIFVILLKRGYFPGPNAPMLQVCVLHVSGIFCVLSNCVSAICLLQVKARMLRASAEVKAWANANCKLRLPSRWRFTKTRLGLKQNKFVHYHGKGFHVSVLLSFLNAFLEDKPLETELKMLVWSGDTLMSFLHNQRKDGLLLTEHGARQVLVLGEYHMNQLLLANRKFRAWPTYKLFNVRPKFHSMSHILEFSQSRRNPVAQSCWMEEDWIRTVANLAKKTHQRKTQLSTLQRYAAGTLPFFSEHAAYILSCRNCGRTEMLLGRGAGGSSTFNNF